MSRASFLDTAERERRRWSETCREHSGAQSCGSQIGSSCPHPLVVGEMLMLDVLRVNDAVTTPTFLVGVSRLRYAWYMSGGYLPPV